METKKRILKNRPLPNAEGQYTYEVLPSGVETNIGQLHENSKFDADTELYTTSEEVVINNELLINNVNDDSQGSSVMITELDIVDNDGGDCTRNCKSTVFFADEWSRLGSILSGDLQPPPAGDTFDTPDRNIKYKLRRYTVGEITTDVTGFSGWVSDIILKNFPQTPESDYADMATDSFNKDINHWYYTMTAEVNEVYDHALLQSSQQGYFYVAVLVEGDQQNWGHKDGYQIFPIPKADLKDIWLAGGGSEIEIAFLTSAEGTYDIEYGMANQGTSYSCKRYEWTTQPYGDCGDPVHKVNRLVVKFMGPSMSEITNSSVSYGNVVLDEYEEPLYVDDDDLWMLNPNRFIDYTLFTRPEILDVFTGDTYPWYLDGLSVPDYRTVTTAISYSEYDMQQYYTDPLDMSLNTAPTIVNLNFELAENLPTYNIQYLYPDIELEELAGVNQWRNFGYKVFVADWDWKEIDPDGSELVDTFPKNESDLILKQLNDGTFIYLDLEDSVSYDTERNVSFLTSLSHQYNTPGIKTIKAFVFSYVAHSDDVLLVQALRWKMLTIKINLYEDVIYYEDFGELGTRDFTVLPWPYTTPIISGISTESKYYSSVKKVFLENKFYAEENISQNNMKKAYDNLPGNLVSELGEYVGKSDIEQMRYFSKPYSINDLLMIDIVNNISNTIHPHWDNNHWRNIGFSDESCVGTIFINDTINIELHKTIVFEFNMANVHSSGKYIADSSGRGFTAVLLGDYSITKGTKGEDVYRDNSIELPGISDENPAL